jgi:dTDP-glucose 4,6-dehydratase
MSKRVLLTGIGGFIGSHCLEYFLDKTDWHIVGLDSFRHKGTYSRLSEVKNYNPDRVTILRHDLTVPIDRQLENKIMGRTLNGSQKIDYIINLASDSAVERSVSDPGNCWRNNCELIYNMLELARRIEPDIFFQCSTDEVYGDCLPGYAHKEWDIILPSNPYAASKAAQEALAISYWRSFKVPVVLTNTMNNVAEWQDREKFLPKLIWKIATDQEMEIYADIEGGDLMPTKVSIGSRYYLHAKNHADVFLFLAKLPVTMYHPARHNCHEPDRYNVCGDVEMNNLEVAQLVAEIMGKDLKYKLVQSESARPGYDRRYALDATKLKDMGWTPPIGFREGLERIVTWTMQNPHWVV